MRKTKFGDQLRRFRLELTIALLVAALIGGVWAIACHSVALAERRGEEQAFAAVRNLNRLMCVQVLDTLKRIGFLQHHAEAITRAHMAGNHAAAAAMLDELRDDISPEDMGIVQLGATDAAGEILWSVLPVPEGLTNLADREHIRAIIHDGRDNFVGRRLRGSISGRWSVQFAKAMRDADGSLRAINVVSIDPNVLRALATDLSAANPGVFTVLRSDGAILARSNGQVMGQGMGQSIPPDTAILHDALKAGSTAEHGMSPVDHVARFHASQRIPDTDIVVVTGLDESAQLAPVRAAEREIHAWASAVSAMLLILGVMADFGIRRQLALTRARRNGREIARREVMLRQLAEGANDVITLQDRNLVNIYANPACRRVLGLEPAQIIGQRHGKRIFQEDAAETERAIADLQRNGGARRLTYRLRHQDGGLRWVETEMVCLSDADEEDPSSCHYICIARDITKRKADEAARRQAEDQLKALLRFGPGMLYYSAIDARGGRTEMNVYDTSMAERMGYSAAQVNAPLFFQNHVHPDDMEAERAALDQCLRTGTASVEYRFPDAAGKWRWMRDEKRMAAPDGLERRVVGYLTDITAEREATARLRRSESLAQLGKVTTDIAHEINQPVATIAMAAENGLRNIEVGRSGQDVAAKFERIRNQADRIAQVIKHIRLSGHDQAAYGADFAVADLVRGALVLVEARLEAMNIIVETDVPAGLPDLHLPLVTLEQVIMNLVVNACDAYEAAAAPGIAGRGRRIRIAAGLEGDAMLIRVEDEAGGIGADVIEHIFDPFFTTKTIGKGTGIGLSISLDAVREMGGTLSARNEAQGAVFEIRLPLTAGGAGSDAGSMEPVPSHPA